MCAPPSVSGAERSRLRHGALRQCHNACGTWPKPREQAPHPPRPAPLAPLTAGTAGSGPHLAHWHWQLTRLATGTRTADVTGNTGAGDGSAPLSEDSRGVTRVTALAAVDITHGPWAMVRRRPRRRRRYRLNGTPTLQLERCEGCAALLAVLGAFHLLILVALAGTARLGMRCR